MQETTCFQNSTQHQTCVLLSNITCVSTSSFSGHVGRREEAMEVERDGRSEVSEWLDCLINNQQSTKSVMWAWSHDCGYTAEIANLKHRHAKAWCCVGLCDIPQRRGNPQNWVFLPPKKTDRLALRSTITLDKRELKQVYWTACTSLVRLLGTCQALSGC